MEANGLHHLGHDNQGHDYRGHEIMSHDNNGNVHMNNGHMNGNKCQEKWRQDQPGQDNAVLDMQTDLNSNGEVPDHQHAIAEPREGCIVLGKSSDSAHKYNTRFVIDHKLQHKDMTANVFKDTFFPCLLEENRTCVGRFLWKFISSEAFLLSLHLLALALGVRKEALRIRDEDEEGELAHSIAETAAACLQITIRGVNSYFDYHSIKQHVIDVEEITTSKTVRGSSLRCVTAGFIALCVCLVLGAIGCVIAFDLLAHMGWTILSNNFVLVVAMVCAGLVKDRMDKVIAMIREDQHKAVLFEATLLLKEAHGAFSSKAPGQYFYKVNTFLKTLKDTMKFEQPGHIKNMHDTNSDMNIYLTMEMQPM